jgi:chromatin remodeling complex protein RSC6
MVYMVKRKMYPDTPPSDTPVDDTPVDDTPVDDTPPSDTPGDDTPGDDISTDDSESKSGVSDINPIGMYVSKLNTYVSRIVKMNKELKELVSIGKTLEKDFTYIVKVLSKKSRISTGAKRPLSGFAMPSLLSDELYAFMSIEKGTKVPRKDVTMFINEYVKKNDLREKTDRRTIIPDEPLHKIFKSTSENKITYFNLQSYLKHHFVKQLN